jgi:hypothetical protein
MDYTQVLNELSKSTSFDLNRLRVAISKELENPKRIASIKKKLRIGMELSYFHAAENKLRKAKLIEMRQKKMIVLDYEENTRFIIPYYIANIEDVDVNIYESKNTETLTANMLKVGDCVGFDNNGESIVGVITKLNHKTVSLKTNLDHQWRVHYPSLYRVHDGEKSVSPQNRILTIEGSFDLLSTDDATSPPKK